MSADDDAPEFEDRDKAHVHEFRSPVTTQDFFNALRRKGFTANAAAGLSGSGIHESGGNADRIWLDPPTGPETGDAAHGAMQWEGRRKAGLRPTLDSTVNHIYDEIASGSQGLTLEQLNSARTPEEAAALVNRQYERPQYPAASEGLRERYARETFRRYAGTPVPEGPLGVQTPEGASSSGNYLAERQKAKDNERIAASHTAEAHRGTPAGQGRHLAHLHEIHDHLSHLHARIADLEARTERQHRKGVVTDVDPVKHLVRTEIGRDCAGGGQTKSPWLPYAQHAGGQQGLNVHSVPTVGEQVMVHNPDGSPDFTQGLVVRHGFYSANPSPSIDPHADVTVRGTTVNVRSMTSIVHSIGGTLTGALMSLISGGNTRTIDAAGHHISTPGQTTDVSAHTTMHTSSGSHADSATENISHNAGQGLSRVAQNANIDCTALKGNITHNAARGAITSSSLTHSITTGILNIL